MLSIKNATVADIELIRTLAMQVWPQTYTPILGPDQVAYMLQQFYTPEALAQQMAQGHRFLIGHYEGEPVAFASFSEVAPHIFKLHKIYLLPGLQGRGIGKAMLAYIVTGIKALGATTLRLNVNIHNHAAKAFYERTGFTHLLDEDIDIGHGYFMNDHVLSLAPGL